MLCFNPFSCCKRLCPNNQVGTGDIEVNAVTQTGVSNVNASAEANVEISDGGSFFGCCSTTIVNGEQLNSELSKKFKFSESNWSPITDISILLKQKLDKEFFENTEIRAKAFNKAFINLHNFFISLTSGSLSNILFSQGNDITSKIATIFEVKNQIEEKELLSICRNATIFLSLTLHDIGEQEKSEFICMYSRSYPIFYYRNLAFCSALFVIDITNKNNIIKEIEKHKYRHLFITKVMLQVIDITQSLSKIPKHSIQSIII